MKTTNIAIVDDHTMISKAIESMVNDHPNYKVIFNASNGEDFILSLEKSKILPDVVLMDVNMPYKDGIETTQWLAKNHPEINVIALTMEDNEQSIIKMLKAGAKGYLLKDMQPEMLFQAIETVLEKGSFYTDMITQTLLKIKKDEHSIRDTLSDFKDKEIEFIKLSCSELTYKEIAEKMYLSPKTIDGYRDSVFTKLHIKSRVGLVLFALKNNIC